MKTLSTQQIKEISGGFDFFTDEEESLLANVQKPLINNYEECVTSYTNARTSVVNKLLPLLNDLYDHAVNEQMESL